MRPLIDLAASSPLYAGVSECPINYDKIKMVILVEPGTKLPKTLTAEKLEEMAHADGKLRCYGIKEIVEYAKNGGEIQTAAVGYGPEEITGVSARKDTFTLKKFNPVLHAALTMAGNKEWDAYLVDDENVVYGINDGTEELAGFPMANVFSNATPHPTSSAKPTMDVTLSFANPKQAITKFDFIKLSFDPKKLTLSLKPVKLEKTTDGKYKVFEAVGGTDVTRIYGALIATAGTAVLTGATSAATYDSATNVLTIAGSGEVRFKAPSVLFTNNIKGIEQV